MDNNDLELVNKSKKDEADAVDTGEKKYGWSVGGYPPPVIKTQYRKRWVLVVATVVLLLIFAVLVVFIGDILFRVADGDTRYTDVTDNLDIVDVPTTGEASAGDYSLTTAEINKKVSPSVVSIESYTSLTDASSAHIGTGIIMSADGYIITNAHVIEGAKAISVVLSSEKSYTAEVVGRDARTDIAVLKIDVTGLTVPEFGNSDQAEIGETVVAIGNAGGMAGSVSQGVISGLDRLVTLSTGETLNLMQIDASINPGNSGGPLVNRFGQVIGINTAKFASVNYEGIGFAISINEAEPIVEQLIAQGYISGRAKLGVTIYSITAAYAEANGLPVGLYVESVGADSDLNRFGIKAGDVIVEAGGNPLNTNADLVMLVRDKKPGEYLALKIYIADTGEYMEVNVLLLEDRGS